MGNLERAYNTEEMNITYALHELPQIAQTLLPKLANKLILLYGEMGTGKTTLVKAFLGVLGAMDRGSSPTFSLVNAYESPAGKVYHLDLYRLKDDAEAYEMGLEDYLNSENWCFVEWPRGEKNLLPQNYTILRIYWVSKGLRRVVLENN